jgi:hypothetical protein
MNMPVRCANCGLVEDESDDNRPGFIAITYRDVCPTDRGDEVREGEEWLCDDCYMDLSAYQYTEELRP